MKKKMNYVVLDATCDNPIESFDELANSVADYLNDGYALHGGVSLTFVPANSQFSDNECYIAAQAMTKEINVYGCDGFRASDINLEFGKVLVLLGKQGSGKSILAEEIAGRYGDFCTITKMPKKAQFSEKVVILDEVFSLSAADIDRIKAFVTDSTMPFLILCSHTEGLLKNLEPESRRFRVINL